MRLNALKQLFIGLLTLLALQEVTVASPGTAAYAAQKYQEAFTLLSTEAKAGDAEAQYLLGSLYLDGMGVKHSPSSAIRWLKRAVDKRHSGAAQMLGKIYMSGMGVPIDIDTGVHYMELADQFIPDDEDEEDGCD